MTFLELCVRLQREAGIAGPAIPAVTGQTGLNEKIVNWVRDSWVEIQNMRHDWRFMKTPFAKVLVIGQSSYNLLNDFQLTTMRSFDRMDWRIDDGLAFSRMVQTPYARWRERYGPGPVSSGRPSALTFPYPDTMVLNASPVAAYNMAGSFWKTSTALVANADIPGMPADFHMGIVWKALESYGLHEAAPEMVAKGQKKFNQFLLDIVATQVEDTDVGPCPIA